MNFDGLTAVLSSIVVVALVSVLVAPRAQTGSIIGKFFSGFGSAINAAQN